MSSRGDIRPQPIYRAMNDLLGKKYRKEIQSSTYICPFGDFAYKAIMFSSFQLKFLSFSSEVECIFDIGGQFRDTLLKYTVLIIHVTSWDTLYFQAHSCWNEVREVNRRIFKSKFGTFHG